MRKFVTPSVLLLLAASFAACGSDPAANSVERATTNTAQSNSQVPPHGRTNSGDLGVVSSHGSSSQNAGASTASERSLVNTEEMDKRISESSAKANASGASAADKKAAAQAYLARGNVYFNAGQPRLYKYALADFKQTIRYDPNNSEAKEKITTIEDIYASLGKPVPEVPEGQ